MIVRNEARIIERCLLSALGHVDGYVICDTGSSDPTVERIQRLTAEHSIPGTVCRHVWHNFGHNRSLAAQAAREWVVAAGWQPHRTYLLLLDADMVLHADNFDKQVLNAGAYALAQDNRGLFYYNTRLLCLRHEWCAQGATHEYWEATDGEPAIERLGSLWIEDLGDGGSKSNKYARDITLLRQSLAQTPADPRTTFYLAQSYFDVGQFSEASRWYARRIKLGGWEEEVWYARYKRALCALKAGDVPSATALLLEAFDARPTRAEPLKVLAQVQREQGRHQSAFMFAVRGLEIPFPEGDALFVERGVYQWQLWEEIMISAYYVGSQYREMGMSACERLAALRGQEPWFYNYVARNQAYYLDDLDALRRGVWPLPEDLAASADASAASAGAVNSPQALSDVAADDPSTVLWSRADGSCVPVPLPGRTDRWLMLIYEQLSLDSGSIYSHRWLEISSEGGLLRHSRPFRFHHNGTERATRLWSADAERLCVTYECESGEIRWLELSWTTVLASLREAESQRLSGPRLTP